MNPYAASLGTRDPLEAMADTPSRIRRIASTLGSTGLERSYAPGKWTARQLLVHLAQTELAFGVRARMALTADDYVVQPFDQDRWLVVEPAVQAMAAPGGLRGDAGAESRTTSARSRPPISADIPAPPDAASSTCETSR